MGENTSTYPPSQRMTVIDALRGFALLGVILMHMIDHFGYTTVNGSSTTSPVIWDTLAQWFTQIMIRGKFISIFSFLFGLSFYIQMDRASKKGVDFRKRFLWRMILLFLIGLVGTCFTYVDILPIYAVFGVILVFLFPLKNWILLLIVCLLLIGLPNWLIIGFDNIRFENVINEQIAPTITSSTREQHVEWETSQNATFFQTARENLTVKTINKLKFQFIYSSSGYLILALFISGFIVGRYRFFEQVHIRKKRNKMLFFMFLTSTLITLIAIKFLPNTSIDLLTIRATGGHVPFISLVISALQSIHVITLSATLAMGFIVLYQIAGIQKYLNLLTPYGRMGLTNYEIQNVMGAILFSAFGFGSFFGNKGTALLFLLGLIIYSLQIIMSKYWMKRFLYGPLEWFWRSGTYLKWQQFKRKNNS